jgi:adenine deaminase
VQGDPADPIVITNVNVIDRLNEALIENTNAVIEGKLIAQITIKDVAVAGGRVIDGGGRTMDPGLADAHPHRN